MVLELDARINSHDPFNHYSYVMNAKNYSTENPIVLVVDRSWPEDVIDDILNLRCSLQMIRKTLCLSIDEEAVCDPAHYW